MLEFLGILALIAIIFGISLQSAFWGLVSFVVGLIFFCVIINLIGDSSKLLSNWVVKKKQKLTKAEIKRKVRNAKQILFALTIFLTIVTVIIAVWSLVLYGDFSFGVGH